jgi:hypothetical protein
LLDIDSEASEDHDFVRTRYEQYANYLGSVEARLPLNARHFATIPWHYDHEDHRCPHDAWLETLNITEASSGERHERRGISIRIRLLGDYHDGHLELKYEEVDIHSVETPAGLELPGQSGHGDWLIDEITLGESDSVVHQILFSRGYTWRIQSRDVLAGWQSSA